MHDLDPSVESRLLRLETSRRRWRLMGAALACAALLSAARAQDTEVLEKLVVRELVVVDENGTARVRMGSEGDEERRDGSAGILIFDRAGTERGGMVTFDDGTAVLALDAPAGVGAPMRDRAAIVVGADGSSIIKLVDNRTAVPVRLVADPDGGGGIEFLDYDLENHKYTVLRRDATGTKETEHDLGQ